MASFTGMFRETHEVLGFSVSAVSLNLIGRFGMTGSTGRALHRKSSQSHSYIMLFIVCFCFSCSCSPPEFFYGDSDPR